MARRAAAVLAFAGTAVLAGCGGSSSAADPSSPKPLTPLGSPTVSSGSASPSLDPNSDAAILAAVQAYAAEFTEIARTGSTTNLNRIVDSSCPCNATLKSLADQLETAGHHTDAVITASNTRVLRRNATNADVVVTLANETYNVLDADGHTVQQAPPQSSVSTISLERRGDTWLVFYVQSGSQ